MCIRDSFRAFMAAYDHLPDDEGEDGVSDDGHSDDGSGFDGLDDFEPGWQHRLT